MNQNLLISYSTFTTTFGLCLVASTSQGICNVLFFDTQEAAVRDLQSRWPHHAVIHKQEPIHKSVEHYFSGNNSQSEIIFHLQGTPFQMKVWEMLRTIPKGETRSYGALAELLGDKKLSRAVGAAIGNNPIGYIIPCHRVVKSTGELSGYRWGVERKRMMLQGEGYIGK